MDVLLRSDGFVGLPAPGRLYVPCAGEPPAARTRVRRGEAVSGEAPGALSPVDGVVAGASREKLLGGGEIDTVIVEADEGATASLKAQIASPEQAKKVLKELARVERGDLSAE